MDDTEARAILREAGEEPPARGRLSPQWRLRAEELGGPPPPVEGDAYNGGVSEADFADETVAGEPPAPAPVAEVKPRRVRRPPRKPLLASLKTGGKTGKGKRKHPRVPVTDFIEQVWAGLGGLVTRVDPPVGRTLVMQSAAAGDILEDVVKGTVVDTALQPVVRNYQRGRKVAALAGPPVIVAAIEMAQRLPEDQMKLRMAILEPMLVSSLMLWDEVAAEKMEERLERQRAAGPRVEQARRIASLIFAGDPEQVPDAETAAA